MAIKNSIKNARRCRDVKTQKVHVCEQDRDGTRKEVNVGPKIKQTTSM